jgi:hypothetical protein
MSPAASVAVAAPLALLPFAYAVWWLDRWRLFPLARFVAVFALASAAGLLLVTTFPLAAGAVTRAGPAVLSLSPAARARLAGEVLDAARLILVLLVVLLALLARSRVETPLDGIVFGVADGVGCALPAAWLLVETAPAVDAGEVALAALAPVVAGCVLGAAVAWRRLLLGRRWRALALLAGALVAEALVAASRQVAALAGRAWVGALVLAILLALTVVLALLVEVRIGARELTEEVKLGVLPAWAAEVGPRYWRRIRADWWPRGDERRAVARLLVGLSCRKHQFRHLEGERATLYSLEVGRMRERARRLLDPAWTPAAAEEHVE